LQPAALLTTTVAAGSRTAPKSRLFTSTTVRSTETFGAFGAKRLKSSHPYPGRVLTRFEIEARF